MHSFVQHIFLKQQLSGILLDDVNSKENKRRQGIYTDTLSTHSKCEDVKIDNTCQIILKSTAFNLLFCLCTFCCCDVLLSLFLSHYLFSFNWFAFSVLSRFYPSDSSLEEHRHWRKLPCLVPNPFP